MHGHGHDGEPAAVADPTAAAPQADFLTTDKIILLFGLVTYGIGQSVLYIVFQPLVTVIGLETWQYGFIMSASNLMLAIMAFFWGRRSDRVGRKPTLLLGLFGYALGTTGVALALEWGVRSSPAPWTLFGVILLARLLYGALASAINPAASGYIADTTSRENRGRGMALLGMTSGIGTVLGPVLGGALAFVSVIFPLYAAVGLSVIALVGLAVVLKEPERAPAPPHASNKLSPFDPRIRSFLVLFFCFWLFFTIIQTIMGFLFAQRLGISDPEAIASSIAGALTAMALLAVFMQLVVIQKLKITARTMLRLGLPAFAVGMVVLLFATSMIWMWLAFGLFGVALALSNPGITASASLMVEPHEQGAVGGLLSAVPVLGMSVGPLLGTLLFGISPTLPVQVGVVAFVLLSVYAFTLDVPEK
ncbi:MAG: MFS transporter [Gammaproteobacteria bacterium]|jgi:MFS family permease|nr:MFS transporter [Gammaproteobacteria bacterium]